MIVSAFACLVGSGGGPYASIFMGKNDMESAEKTLGNCFMLQIIISVILTAILLIFNKDMLLAFGASKNTIEYATSYMNIYAICNIILDPILIFGFNMGVRGAALATILSQAISCIWVLNFLFGKKTFLKIRLKNLKLESKIILPCLGLGVSTFVMQASESLISVCFNSSLLKYGGDIAVGAMTILTSVMQFAMLPLQGLGQGAQPIISYNYGAKKSDRVKGTFKLLLKSNLIFSVVLWALVIIFPQIFVKMFTSDPKLIIFAQKVLRIYMASVFLMGIQVACQMTFTSIGYAKASIIVAVMRKFILLLPLIFILPHILTGNETIAVYLAEPIADFLAVTFTIFLFRVQFKKALSSLMDINVTK